MNFIKRRLKIINKFKHLVINFKLHVVINKDRKLASEFGPSASFTITISENVFLINWIVLDFSMFGRYRGFINA